jgi:hypothetical protein
MKGSITASTQAKHLRVLNACLQAAVENGYAARNPVKQGPPLAAAESEEASSRVVH